MNSHIRPLSIDKPIPILIIYDKDPNLSTDTEFTISTQTKDKTHSYVLFVRVDNLYIVFPRSLAPYNSPLSLKNKCHDFT